MSVQKLSVAQRTYEVVSGDAIIDVAEYHITNSPINMVREISGNSATISEFGSISYKLGASTKLSFADASKIDRLLKHVCRIKAPDAEYAPFIRTTGSCEGFMYTKLGEFAKLVAGRPRFSYGCTIKFKGIKVVREKSPGMQSPRATAIIEVKSFAAGDVVENMSMPEELDLDYDAI